MANGNQREAVQFAYLAGILDGEGCFAIKKTKPLQGRKNPWYSPCISVGMTSEPVIQLLKDTFGGSMRKERARKGYKPIYRWAVTSKRKAIKVLKKVRPYLIEKKEQADVLFDYCKKVKAPENRKVGISPEELQFREDAYLLMRKLKESGAPATTERNDTGDGEATV